MTCDRQTEATRYLSGQPISADELRLVTKAWPPKAGNHALGPETLARTISGIRRELERWLLT